MRVAVLGGCGAWPAAGQACSGYLIEHDGFTLLLDPGYATVPRLLGLMPADRIDAVFVTHGHPDHCVDLNPLLRARKFGERPAAPLPVYAPHGALDAVLALEPPGGPADAYLLREFAPGDRCQLGPLRAETRLLPHWLPNAGVRLSAGGTAVAYTGDTGPSPDVVRLASGADLLLAEATYVDQVPEPSRRYLSSARDAGRYAHEAGVGRLVLTHLWPGTAAAAASAAAGETYRGPVDVAAPGLAHDLH